MTIRRDLHEVAFTAAHVSTGSYHSDASYRICCLYAQCLTHTETAEENNLASKVVRKISFQTMAFARNLVHEVRSGEWST